MSQYTAVRDRFWRITRSFVCSIVLGVALIAFGCSGASEQTGGAAKYPTGISEDIQQQLKYDARVDSFSEDEANLVVEVNAAWLNSPPGMQERSVGQWYGLWHANHSGGVVVQHGGNKVASWTSESGYKPESKSSEGEPHTEG